MKKRLLSAALALAMVLTLLPMSAFAADPTPPSSSSIGDSGKTTVTYYEKIQPTMLDDNGDAIGPGWYYAFQKDMGDNKKETRYASISSGVIAGVGTSGTWYSANDLVAGTAPNIMKQTSFTLLEDITISGNLTQNLTVDTNGKTLAISGTPDMTKVTSLTVYDKQYVKDPDKNTQGSVKWGITHADDGDKHANTQSFTLTLQNGGQLVGDVKLSNHAAHTINMSNYGKIDGAVTMSGNATNGNAQNVTLTTNCEITGKTTLTGNSTRVSVTSSKMGELDLTGTGTNLSVSGITTEVGAVNLASGQDKETGTNATVTISQGKVDSITQKTGEKLKSAISITVGENGTVEKKTTIVNSANITVNRGTMGEIALPSGNLTVNGPNADIGNLTLNTSANTTFKVSGTGNEIGDVTASNGASLTVDIAAEPTNTFGTTSLTGYEGHGIKGGTFASLAPEDGSLANKGDDALIYKCAKTGEVTFYKASQLADALYKQVTESGTLTIVGQGSSSTVASGTIQFKRGDDDAGTLTYVGVTSIAQLPNKALGTAVGTWMDEDNNKTYNAGSRYDAPQSGTSQKVVLVTQGSSQVVTKISGVKASSTSSATGQSNQDITAGLSGNVITLSGAVSPVGGIASFQINLVTDLLDDSQMPITIPVWVNYDSVNNRTYFGNQTLTGGLTVNADGSKLTLFDGDTSYTLNGSGLKVIVGGLKTDDGTNGEIEAVYTGTGDKTTKDYIASLIDGTNDGATAGAFTWDNSTAIKQAINAVQASISESQIKSWREQAQRKAWQAVYAGSPTKDQYSDASNDAKSGTYQDVYLVPYLYVSASNYNQNATLNATLSVYYRVEVRSTEADLDPIEVQAGRTLGNLGEELSTGATVKFGSGLSIATATGAWMHQDDTYAYQNASGVYTINHMGKTGLGTIVINKTQPLVELKRAADANTGRVPANTTAYYDTLQAAVDDTLPQAKDKLDEITVKDGYKGSSAIDVTGLARTFTIKTENNTEVTRASNNFTLTPVEEGREWTVQLLKDTAPAGGNITIASATGGTASVSSNPAAAGSTVTVTLSAQAGYTPAGVTVKNSSGGTVSVSGSGSTYTFTMPSGTVTVTPSFTQTQTVTNATVSVSNPNRGSGTAATSVGSNRVAPGTTVTVSTTPGSGQRTMGLNVTGATAYRTGENQFTFTVPSGYSNVVVTPTFDAQNGTSFSDVWSTEYFSPAVAWAVGRGITNGTSTYTFGSYNSCTREDMVTFLYRAAGSPAVGNVRNPFWDVQPGSYYYNAVMWAVSKGITNGVSATQFGVGQNVTRAQAVTFLYRYNGSPAASTNSGFYDVPSSEYFAKAVSWANATGVTNGTSTTAFSPNLNCQRAQIVSFLYRNATGVRA